MICAWPMPADVVGSAGGVGGGGVGCVAGGVAGGVVAGGVAGGVVVGCAGGGATPGSMGGGGAAGDGNSTVPGIGVLPGGTATVAPPGPRSVVPAPAGGA